MRDRKLNLQTDAPISDKEGDLFGRWEYVNSIAEIIKNQDANECFTIGLHAPWGAGKTTALNFLKSSLESESDYIVLSYNPWRFSDEQSMILAFFKGIANAIGEQLGDEKNKFINAIADYTDQLTVGFGLPNILSKIIKEKCEVSDEALLNQLALLLNKSDKRMVVLIDDIDRLDGDEIKLLFKLVKACGNLPRITYVLAFDDSLASGMLASSYSIKPEEGRAFIEKLVQLPLNLPVARKSDLLDMMYSLLDPLLTKHGLKLDEEKYRSFYMGYNDCLSYRLLTPRLVKLYINNLAVALGSIGQEVNLVDLLLIEGVRLAYPDIYTEIKMNQGDYSGTQNITGYGDSDQIAKDLLEPKMDKLGKYEQKRLVRLLIKLFPRLSKQYGMASCGEYGDAWYVKRRIASPEYTSRYFSYGIAKEDVPDKLISDLFAADGTGLSECYKRLLNSFQHNSVIEKIRVRSQSDDINNPDHLSSCLVENAHLLDTKFDQPFFTMFRQISMTVASLVSSMPPETRLGKAKELIDKANPHTIQGDICYAFRFQEREPNHPLTEDEADTLNAYLQEKIVTRIDSGHKLLDSGRENFMMIHNLDDPEKILKVKERLFEEISESADALHKLFEYIATVISSSAKPYQYIDSINRGSLEYIEKYVGIEVVQEVIQNFYPDIEVPNEYVEDRSNNLGHHIGQFLYLVANPTADEPTN